jgi:hypothetical protein
MIATFLPRLRTPLPALQENQHLDCLRWPAPWHQGGRRWHLAGQLYGLRSRLYRSGAKDLATPRQPVRFRCPCLRAGQSGKLVGVAGFEPVTLLVPNAVRYQTTLRSDLCQPANLTPSPYHGAGARTAPCDAGKAFHSEIVLGEKERNVFRGSCTVIYDFSRAAVIDLCQGVSTGKRPMRATMQCRIADLVEFIGSILPLRGRNAHDRYFDHTGAAVAFGRSSSAIARKILRR